MAVNNVLNTGAAIVLGGTLTTAGALTFSGAFAFTGTLTASTSVTFPTSGILATTIQSMPFTTVSGTTQTVTAGNGYITNNAGLVTVTLPATATVGDQFHIVGLGAGGWTLAYTTNQFIRLGNQVSTTTSGSVASTNRYDSCYIVCTVTNNEFRILSAVGNLTVA